MVWYGMVWYGMVWYVMVLYCIVLFCIALHCIVLCCIVLYCIVLNYLIVGQTRVDPATGNMKPSTACLMVVSSATKPAPPTGYLDNFVRR